MCGHVGVAGTMAKVDIDVFNDLLYFDTLRGPHSTGVAAVNRNSTNRSWDLLKRVGPAYQLMENKRYDSVVSLGNSAIIGHNRHATVGKINNANAHPFEFEHIVGAHNGTIPWDERSSIIGGDKFDTDSEGIFNMINEFGIEQTIPELYGAWALVWYDKRDHTLNMLRNDQRDLFYVISKSGRTIYWASESAMLHAALMRRGIEYEKATYIRPDVHYKFRIPDTHGGEFGDPEQVKLCGRTEATKRTYPGYTHGFPNRGKEEGDSGLPFGARGGPTTPTIGKQLTDSNDDEDWARPSVAVQKKRKIKTPLLVCYKNEVMGERAYKARTGQTCCQCDKVVPFEEVHEGKERVKFMTKDTFLCEECAEDDWVSSWFGEAQRIMQ